VSLQDWLKSRWLIEHQTSRQEILALLSMADRDLAQCQTPHLSPDWQLNIAYNAALQAATAALVAAGYRAAREAHHYRVIQSLAHTIEADPHLIIQLDKFRKKRNITEYEQAGAVSEQEAKEMFALAKKLRDEVEKWLRSNHPELL
jgi:uncharacterized protein (UPF0332 family)